MIEFARATLSTCAQAEGVVVVIDVLRAFSTAAYAFAAGAKQIMLVSAVNEALALRQRFPDALLMGEVGGLPISGFDFGNSPAQLAGMDLRSRRLIQRTSAGTQGVVRSQRADVLLTSSFVVAGATVAYLRQLAPRRVTFVITGAEHDSGSPLQGDEDAACADYLEALLRGQQPDPELYFQRVRGAPDGLKFGNSLRPDFPAIDLDYCTRVDHFPFAMRVRQEDGLFLMEIV